MGASLPHEVREERLVLPGFRMPLHADQEAQGRILDRLQRPVAGPGRLDEPLPDAADSLVVVRRDIGAGSDHRREPCAVLHLDRVLCKDPRHPLVLVRTGLVR